QPERAAPARAHRAPQREGRAEGLLLAAHPVRVRRGDGRLRGAPTRGVALTAVRPGGHALASGSGSVGGVTSTAAAFGAAGRGARLRAGAFFVAVTFGALFALG